jgi:hypothetical protein
MRRTSSGLVLALGLVLTVLGQTPASAQGGDVTFFGGYAYPTYSQQFTYRPPMISVPGIEVRPEGELTLDAKGGLTIGVAGAFELGGFFAIEGRFDSTAIDLYSSGVRYTVSGSGLSGALSIGQGPLSVDRLNLLSLNLRLRTPGAVSLYASGGLSYLPKFEVSGSIPLSIQLPGTVIPDTQIPLRLVVAPSDSSNRVGVNGGLGLRVKVAPGVSLIGEIRGFYFKRYDLILESTDRTLNTLVGGFRTVQFDPIVVNATGGLSISF